MRTVIKVGTSTLAHAGGRLNIRRVELLCKILSDLKNAGHELVLVSSGAIGMGVGKLGLPGRPADMPGKQAAAAVGRCRQRKDHGGTAVGEKLRQAIRGCGHRDRKSGWEDDPANFLRKRRGRLPNLGN